MSWITPLVLSNQHVRLEPLAPSHLAELVALPGDDEALFRLQPVDAHGGPFPRWAKLWFDKMWATNASGTELSFVVRDAHSGSVVGSTSYLALAPAHRRVEIGATWYLPTARGTAVNPACKLLLLQHAFETLGCHRVELKTDLRNERSQRAIEKLGALREGVFRRHMILGDGYVRDTVYYSVIDAEWPSVAARLRARLEGR